MLMKGNNKNPCCRMKIYLGKCKHSGRNLIRYKKEQSVHTQSSNLATPNLFATHRSLNDPAQAILPNPLLDKSPLTTSCKDFTTSKGTPICFYSLLRKAFSF